MFLTVVNFYIIKGSQNFTAYRDNDWQEQQVSPTSPELFF